MFLDCIYGLPPQQYLPVLAKEIEDLKKEQSPVQNTVRTIIARESCIQQIKELETVLVEADKHSKVSTHMLEECVNIFQSLRMLTLHVVKSIAEWRRQLIFNHLLTAGNESGRNNMDKFKNCPFIWEGGNYLLKIKSDTQFLSFSDVYSKYFNFTAKSDPFLVQPSVKH